MKKPLTQAQLDHRKAYQKQYELEHKDTRKVQAQAWRAAHRTQLATRQREYYQQNTNHYRDYVRNKNLARRIRVLAHYSGGKPKCSCCGETILDFLTIDHVNLNGAAHRREISGSERAAGQTVYKWLEQNNYPEGFQVLCYNCNCGSFKHKGTCPHKLSVV